MIKHRNFQPVKSSPTRHSIGGSLAVTALLGMVVVRATNGTDALALATGQAGYFLMKDVVSAEDLEAAVRRNADPTFSDMPVEFEYPTAVGGSVQACDYEEVWVEGEGLIHDLDENTAVGTKVTTNAGKIAELTDEETQECLGVIRAIEAAKNSEAPAKRFLIQVIREAKTIPAA